MAHLDWVHRLLRRSEQGNGPSGGSLVGARDGGFRGRRCRARALWWMDANQPGRSPAVGHDTVPSETVMKTPSRTPPFVHICFPTSAKDDSRRSLHFAFLIKLLKSSAPSHSSRQLGVTDGPCVHTGFTWGKFSGSQTGEKRMPKESKPFRREKTRHDSETRSCCSSSVLLSGSGTPRPCASR